MNFSEQTLKLSLNLIIIITFKIKIDYFYSKYSATAKINTLMTFHLRFQIVRETRVSHTTEESVKLRYFHRTTGAMANRHNYMPLVLFV